MRYPVPHRPPLGGPAGTPHGRASPGRHPARGPARAGRRAAGRRAWADAAEIYAAYLRRNPEHWQIWAQYGHCTKECGDAETALLLYREAEKLRPAEADIHLHLGHALKVLDRRDEASEAYSRALSLDPANAAARAELLAAAAGFPPVAQAPPATAAVAAACG
jgi:tetratricopeptide (TPR) repeat protein